MLSAAFRLSLRDYPDFFTSSRKAYSKHFMVFWRKQPPSGATVVVSAKQLSRAIDRNTVKRKLRAALMRTRVEWQEYQVVVVGKRTVLETRVEDLAQELRVLFSKIHK